MREASLIGDAGKCSEAPRGALPFAQLRQDDRCRLALLAALHGAGNGDLDLAEGVRLGLLVHYLEGGFDLGVDDGLVDGAVRIDDLLVVGAVVGDLVAFALGERDLVGEVLGGVDLLVHGDAGEHIVHAHSGLAAKDLHLIERDGSPGDAAGIRIFIGAAVDVEAYIAGLLGGISQRDGLRLGVGVALLCIGIYPAFGLIEVRTVLGELDLVAVRLALLPEQADGLDVAGLTEVDIDPVRGGGACFLAGCSAGPAGFLFIEDAVEQLVRTQAIGFVAVGFTGHLEGDVGGGVLGLLRAVIVRGIHDGEIAGADVGVAGNLGDQQLYIASGNGLVELDG